MDDKQAAQQKLEHLEREYWRVRNGKQRYLRCPYCTPTGDLKEMFRNFPGAPQFCCSTFARAFKAILDRQDQVDTAYAAAKHTIRALEMAAKN